MAVLLLLVTGTVVAVVFDHVSVRPLPAPPLRHTENCRPSDQWLTKARQALTANRPRDALNDLSLSRRDCEYDLERERLEALAYVKLGDRNAALAAANRYYDASARANFSPELALDPNYMACDATCLLSEWTKTPRHID